MTAKPTKKTRAKPSAKSKSPNITQTSEPSLSENSKNIDNSTKWAIHKEAKDGRPLNFLAEKYGLSTIQIAEIINQQRPKHPTGRPKIFTDPAEMAQHIENFFDYCGNTLIIKQVVSKGDIILVPTPTPPTMAGLAVWLNMSRETLNQYRKDKPFSDIIIRARCRIETDNVTKGMLGVYEHNTNRLNIASNFGYAQKQELTGKDGEPLFKKIEIVLVSPGEK